MCFSEIEYGGLKEDIGVKITYQISLKPMFTFQTPGTSPSSKL